ncbi:hypothetical protein HKD37_05G013733 [Glycine soja]
MPTESPSRPILPQPTRGLAHNKDQEDKELCLGLQHHLWMMQTSKKISAFKVVVNAKPPQFLTYNRAKADIGKWTFRCRKRMLERQYLFE